MLKYIIKGQENTSTVNTILDKLIFLYIFWAIYVYLAFKPCEES